MKFAVRNYTKEPLAVFIEIECDQYGIPPGGQAIVTLGDDRQPSFDVYDGQLTIWNESLEPAIVEVFEAEPPTDGTGM